ncbi:MAG: arginine--tRNA ligase [Candidatus Daviesbacteria bacterium]|nr:arginine--tRNA ligase [Candidatus Daviesbacteria bacterium]
MIKQQLESDLKKAVLDLGFKVDDIVCDIPQNSSFGDYTSNIALQLSKQKSENTKQSPVEIAKEILEKLGKVDYLDKSEIKGPGFLNFFIKDEILIKNLAEVLNPEKVNSQKILVEYGHANILKEVHIGHLRTFILGESLARIFEFLGHNVFRANYQGDIGLHVAKAVWGMKKLGLPSESLNGEEKAEYLGKAYALGSSDYDSDPSFKQQIDHINVDLYKKDSEYWGLYKMGRQWSIDYFEGVYKLLGIKYDRCYFESEVYERGKELVEENLGKIFEKSDGAVIFQAEKYGLHNRVFLNSAGNPTYEAKDMGLAELEYKNFSYDKSIHIVGSEQAGYFQVIIKAIELLFPNLKGKKYHLSYGMVGIKGGKMSSRTGEVVTVDELFHIVVEKVREVMKESRLEINQEIAKQVSIGAIKFAYLKFSPTSNMIFDLDQSVSLQGDSGPYLQYTYARIQSLLKKADFSNEKSIPVNLQKELLELEERNLLRRLEYFSQIVSLTGLEYRPNLICEYLLDLAKDFNLFYQKHRIIESEKKELRLVLASKVGDALKTGLNLLGIDSPERM